MSSATLEDLANSTWFTSNSTIIGLDVAKRPYLREQCLEIGLCNVSTFTGVVNLVAFTEWSSVSRLERLDGHLIIIATCYDGTTPNASAVGTTCLGQSPRGGARCYVDFETQRPVFESLEEISGDLIIDASACAVGQGRPLSSFHPWLDPNRHCPQFPSLKSVGGSIHLPGIWEGCPWPSLLSGRSRTPDD